MIVLRRALDDQHARGRRARPAPTRGAARNRTAPRRCARHSRKREFRGVGRGSPRRAGCACRVSKPLLTAASSSTRRALAPSVPGGRSSVMRASVSVPVLSVHSTSIAPRSWIAASRFTTTLRAAMRTAPRDSVTVMIIGSSSGVSADRKRHREQERLDHRARGRRDARAARTAPERPSAAGSARRRRAGRARRLVGGGPDSSAAAMPPKRVRPPVATTSMVASPLTRHGAAEQRIERFRRLLGAAQGPARFSTGKASPVSSDSFVWAASASQHDAVGGHEIAGARARRRRRRRCPRPGSRDRLAVAPHRRAHRHRALERLDGVFRLVLLHDVERDRDRQNRQDDRCSSPRSPVDARHDRRDSRMAISGSASRCMILPSMRWRTCFGDRVAAVFVQTLGRVGGAQSRRRGAELRHELGRAAAPEWIVR